MESRLGLLGILSVLPFPDPCHSLGFCYNKTISPGSVDVKPINYKIRSFVSLNNADCAKECAYEEECLAFFVENSTGMCTLSSRPLSSLTMLDDDGWFGYDFTGEYTCFVLLRNSFMIYLNIHNHTKNILKA